MEATLVCSECGTGFQRPGARGPIPTRCPDCKRSRKRVQHAKQEQVRVARKLRQEQGHGEYVCGVCGVSKKPEAFTPSQRRNGGWCRACHRETYIKRSGGLVDRPCEICGTTFSVTRRSGRKFCGRACKARAMQMRQSARLLESKRGRPCANCGEEIPPTKLGQARYCSEECRRIHAGPAIRRRSMLKRLYGLTPECYDRLVEQQGDRCAICRTDDQGAKGIWHVDHCHATGAVRGLLCSRCNTGLGQFQDRADLLRAAITYLQDGTA